MAARLPEGLIRTSDGLGENIRSAERIDAATLRNLWHVFQVNARFLEDASARRMENFFWRIWSNRNIHTSITNSNIGRLAGTFAQGGNQLPASPPFRPPQTQELSSSQTTVTPVTPETQQDDSSNVTPRSSLDGSQQQAALGIDQPATSQHPSLRLIPPPILKKSKSDEQGSSHGMGLPDPRRSDRSPSLTASSSQAVLSPYVDEKGPGPNRNRKKSSTNISSAASKSRTRPGMPRKRSSQGVVPQTRKSPAVSPRIKAQQGSTAPPAMPYKTARGQSARFSLGPPESHGSDSAFLSGSWQDDDSPAQSQDLHPPPFAQPSTWFVEPDFRSRFAEQKKRAASHGNLANLNRTTSSVRFMEELPERRKGSKRYSEVDTQGNIVRNMLQSASSLGKTEEQEPCESEGDDVAVDDESESPMLLPKTKSQLSMMIARQRRSSGGSLGPDPKPPAGEDVDPVVPSTATEDDDGEYLTLGMGVGQTKIRTGSKSKDKGKGKGKATDEEATAEDEERYGFVSHESVPAW